MNAATRLILCCCVLAACLVGAGAPFADDSAAALQSLDPARPRSYLDAADRLIPDPASVRLAQETLAIGLLLCVESDASLAASMAIALASVSEDPDDRAALRTLAVTIDPDRADELRWLSPESLGRAGERDTAGKLLAGIRQNDPRAAESWTDAHETIVLNEATRLGFPRARIASVLRAWIADARDDPCRGRRFVQRRERDRTEVSPCPDPSYHHDATPGADRDAMCSIELSLRGVVPDAWRARLALRLDPPVPTCTPATIARRFGVTQDRPLRRGDRWVAR